MANPFTDPFQFDDQEEVEYKLEVSQETLGVWYSGKVVGCSTTPLPICGRIYLVEDKIRFPNEIYPFCVIPIMEVHIRKVDKAAKVA